MTLAAAQRTGQNFFDRFEKKEQKIEKNRNYAKDLRLKRISDQLFHGVQVLSRDLLGVVLILIVG